jgi:hypothetical protein
VFEAGKVTLGEKLSIGPAVANPSKGVQVISNLSKGIVEEPFNEEILALAVETYKYISSKLSIRAPFWSLKVKPRIVLYETVLPDCISSTVLNTTSTLAP